MWECPKCKNQDLEVCVSTFAALVQNGEDNFETDIDLASPQNSDHEWNEGSSMHCRDFDCDFRGKEKDFEVESPFDRPDDSCHCTT